MFRPIDCASLAAFRILFGALMVWSIARYFVLGRITRYYVDPPFSFKYFGFEWVQALPPLGMYVLFGAMMLFALGITIGLWYRTCAALFFVTFTYAYLLEQARYLNHYYLICLLAFLMIFLPVQREWSLDARRRPLAPFAPRWALWLLQCQLGLVYFFAGVAKLNVDWIRGEPMRMWLADRADYVLVGPLFTQEWVVMTMSWGALVFDLLVAPLLLWPRTRKWAFAAAVGFHLLNAIMFQIGVFPWMMIAATTLFFAPDWPRNYLGLPATGAADEKAAAAVRPRAPAWVCTLVAGWVLLQVLIPLRHWLYPGRVSWTEEGHMFSWHMKLRSKRSKMMLIARDPESRRIWRIDPADDLTDWQLGKMSGRPDMILQYAHHIAARFEQREGLRVEVRADARVSLNGRPRQRLIDPNVDLAAEPRRLGPQPWILPLRER